MSYTFLLKGVEKKKINEFVHDKRSLVDEGGKTSLNYKERWNSKN